MTEVNGLRLAFRGLIGGMAAGWVWLAIVMVGSLATGDDPLRLLRLIGAGTPHAGLAVAAAVLQIAAGGIGLGFAYFFGRYFTVRPTLTAAAISFALLCWLAAADLGAAYWAMGAEGQLILGVASLAYGLMLGAATPLRGEVLRGYPPAGSASAGSAAAGSGSVRSAST